MNSKVFVPFGINEQFDTPLIEMDPDMQFYLESKYIKNTKCDFYLEQTFVKNITKSEQQKQALSMFHINIKSLPKHFDELQQYQNILITTIPQYTDTIVDVQKLMLACIPSP